MDELVTIILNSGEKAVKLLLYTLLPIMVVMMAFMRLLENSIVFKCSTDLLRRVKIHELSVLFVVAVQTLFVSFAAPAATLKIMDDDQETNDGTIAAALAMIFTMSQANAVYPLIAVGLNFWALLATSFVCGIVAILTCRWLIRRFPPKVRPPPHAPTKKEKRGPPDGRFRTLINGGHEGVDMVVKLIPILMLTMLVLEVMKEFSVLVYLEQILAAIGLPREAATPLVTKYLAGGTAMMGVVTKMAVESEQQLLTGAALNRVAGFMINPLDPVGFAVLATVGPRVKSVAIHAIGGAIVGILLRGGLHLWWFWASSCT